MTIIWTTAQWTREQVVADTERNYAFGDNLQGVGNAGQACIRGLPNAFGIPTKAAPGMLPGRDFFDDSEQSHWHELYEAIGELPADKPLVVNINIGRGLAEMHMHAPLLYAEMLRLLLALTAEAEL